MKKIYLKHLLSEGGFYLIPLFFLIFSSGSDFFKFFILTVFFPLFIFITYFLSGFYKKSYLNLYTYEKILILFLLLALFASILSGNIFSSFFGDYNNHIFSFISVFIFFSSIFFISRLNLSLDDEKKFLKIFFYSTIILFGYKFFSSFFPIISIFKFSTEDLLIIASLIILIFTPLYLNNFFLKKEKNVAKFFLLFLFFLLSVVFYKPLFFLFLFVFFTQLILIYKSKIFFQLKLKSSLLIIFVFFFGLLLSVDSENIYNIKKENLNFPSSLKVASSLGAKDFLFGDGFHAYSQFYSLNRSENINYTKNWQIRYKNSFSFLLNLPPTVGYLATFSFLSFLIYLFFISISSLKTYKDKKKNDFYFYSFYSAFLYVLLLPFLITFTYISFLFFCLFISVFLAYIIREAYFSPEKQKIKNSGNLFQLVFLVFIGIWFITFAYSLKYLIADNYSKSKDEYSLTKAIEFNPNIEEYYIFLSKEYLNKAKAELAKANKDYGLIARLVSNSKDWAEKSIEVNSKSVLTYETLGIIYRDFANYSSNGEIFAIEPLKKAFSLEPTNPVLATEIGKLYLILDNTEEALYYFNKAYSLKNDYYDAQMGIARVMIKNNNQREAIEILEELQDNSPNKSQVYFEMGRAYYNISNFDSAVKNFEKSLFFDENNSNALYSLAVAYEKKNDLDRALFYFEKTLFLNPGNTELILKVNELKK